MSAQQSIKTLIQQQTDQTLPNLSQKITQLQRLNELWQKYIDMKLTKHTRVANWRDGRLVIEIDNASWATHVRYSLPELLIKLKTEKELSELKYIDWYIKTVAVNSHKTNSRKPNPLTPAISQLIAEAAEHVTHEKLKKALRSLAGQAVSSTSKQDSNPT